MAALHVGAVLALSASGFCASGWNLRRGDCGCRVKNSDRSSRADPRPEPEAELVDRDCITDEVAEPTAPIPPAGGDHRRTVAQGSDQFVERSCAALPLTVVVTTSPCRGGAAVHCALLRALFKSFHHLPGLASVRIILVCDGYKLTKPGGKVRLKGGIVSPTVADGYRQVVDWLRKQLTPGTSHPLTMVDQDQDGYTCTRETLLDQFPHMELMELPEWRGWSSAVEHALQAISTPLVMVVQDDRPFTRKLDGLHLLLAAIVDTARRDEAYAASFNSSHIGSRETIGYVLVPTRKQHDYIAKMRSLAGKRGRKLQPDVHDLPLEMCSDPTSRAGECCCQEAVSPAGHTSEAATAVFQSKNGCAHARLVRCWRLLDSTHIASVAWYRSLYEQYPALKRRGMFAEEVLSAKHMSDSLSGREWPTWILCTQHSSLDSSPPGNGHTSMVEIVAHMDRSSADSRNGYWRQATTDQDFPPELVVAC